MNCAIIPARSGSKRLPNKNIKPLLGMPLMAHTILTALASEAFDEVFVSTDSEQYAEIAKAYGASVPFLRNAKYATDEASSWDVVREAVEYYEAVGKIFSTATLLQPTSPLRSTKDLKAAFGIFANKEARAVVSVCEADYSPLWCNTLPSNGSLNGFVSTDIRTMSGQELPKYYRVNGAIYIIDLAKMGLESIDVFQDDCYAYVMPRHNSIDIDDHIDFLMAKSLMEYSNESQQ